MIKKLLRTDLGDIVVSIRKNLYGPDLVSVSLSKDNIYKYPIWVEFDIPDTYVSSGSTYYIVVHASGGDDEHYYSWMYKSFAFKTYGIDDRDADGVVERWAVLVGISDYAGTEHDTLYNREDAINMKNLLIRHGWQSDHIKLLTDSQATIERIEFAIKQIDFKEDNDDIVLFQFSGHGSPFSIAVYPWDGFYASDLDKDLDKLESKNMALIFDSCGSGGLQDYLGQSGRVVLAAAAKGETAWVGQSWKHCFYLFPIRGF